MLVFRNERVKLSHLGRFQSWNMIGFGGIPAGILLLLEGITAHSTTGTQFKHLSAQTAREQPETTTGG